MQWLNCVNQSDWTTALDFNEGGKKSLDLT